MFRPGLTQVLQVWGQLQIKGVGAASAEHIAACQSVIGETSAKAQMVLMTAKGFLPLDGLLSQKEWSSKFGVFKTQTVNSLWIVWSYCSWFSMPACLTTKHLTNLVQFSMRPEFLYT